MLPLTNDSEFYKLRVQHDSTSAHFQNCFSLSQCPNEAPAGSSLVFVQSSAESNCCVWGQIGLSVRQYTIKTQLDILLRPMNWPGLDCIPLCLFADSQTEIPSDF